MPSPAMARPTSAAASSAKTARSVGLEVLAMNFSGRSPSRLASARVWRVAWTNDTDSSTKAMPSTAYAHV